MKITIFALSILLSCISFAAKPEKGKKKESTGDRPSRAEMIKKFDTDGDGELSTEERAEARKAFMAKRKMPPLLIKKFDKDGDGELNAEEKRDALSAMAARKKEAIEKFDKDGDGKLNEEEKKEAIASRTKPEKGEKRKDGDKGKKEDKKKGKEKGKKKKDSWYTIHLIFKKSLLVPEAFF